jgi:hypothetical protein
MTVILQEFLPYDQSLHWRVHDAYFAQRGMAAWTSGDIPFFATSNYPIARQHARVLVEVFRNRETVDLEDLSALNE